MRKVIYSFILSVLFILLIPINAQAEETYKYIINETDNEFLTSEELSVIDEYLMQTNNKENTSLYFYFTKNEKFDVLVDEYAYLQNSKVVFIDFYDRKISYYSNNYELNIPNFEKIKIFFAEDDFNNAVKEIIYEITDHIYQEDKLKQNYVLNYTNVEIKDLETITQKADDVYKKTGKLYYFLFIDNNYNYLKIDDVFLNDNILNLNSDNVFIINLDTRKLDISNTTDSAIFDKVAVEYFKNDKFVDGINAILDFVISGQTIQVEEEDYLTSYLENYFSEPIEEDSSIPTGFFWFIFAGIGGILVLVVFIMNLIDRASYSSYSSSYSSSNSNSHEDNDEDEDDECDITKEELYDTIREYAKEDYKSVKNHKEGILEALVEDFDFADKEDLLEALTDIVDINSTDISDYIFEKYTGYIDEFEKEDSAQKVKENVVNADASSSTKNTVKAEEKKTPEIKVVNILDSNSSTGFNAKRFNKEIADACELSCTKENYSKVNKLIKQFNNLKFDEKMQVDYSSISRLQTLNNKIEHLRD